jgi:5-methylthioadenosine/S-adenosylhomocysteine deaminase
MTFDLLITNGALLPLTPDMPAEIAPGFVAIGGDRIAAMGPMDQLPEMPVGRRLDAGGCLVLPGLINTHNHSAMSLFRGLADDLPLMVWLQDHIFPAEARFVNEEMVYWSTKLAAAEMILSGTTCVADGYFHEDAAAAAFCETGLRAIAAQGIIDFPAPGIPDPGKNVETAAAFVGKWKNRHPLLTAAIFCHSPYTCSPRTLQQAKKLAVETGVPFFIHVAETREEVEIISQRHGVTPVAHLANNGILDRHTVCVHGIWLTPADLDLLGQTGTGVAICPSSHMKLASGIAQIREFVQRRIPVGIGTDGCASNNTLDLFREMDLFAKLQKTSRLDPTFLSASETLAFATSGGAKLLGLENDLGSLAPGMKADLVIVDLNRPHLTPCYHGASHLVYAARGADVRDVVIDGQLVMAGGEILTIDLRETLTRVRELAAKVTSSLPRHQR